MMNNLFSIFDPSSSYGGVWLLLLILVFVVPVGVWNVSKSSFSLFYSVVYFLLKEVSFTLGSMKKGELTYVLSLFLFTLFMNALALFPQVFSMTSHLVITLPLALSSWLLINLFGWLKNANHMLSHLVPQGTPVALMSFMVLIELISSLIRPITLCVRLTANMIAGHLLMALLGNSLLAVSSHWLGLFIIAPMVLTVLETAVAFIQSYVFMTLITLYITEVK